MTSMRVAAGASEAQAMPGRGRNPLGAQDQGFGAILSDVVQDEAPGALSPAERKGTSASPAPVAARTAAPNVALPIDVDALFARLTATSPSGHPTVPARTSTTREDKPKSRDAPDEHDDSNAKDRAASMDLSVAAGTLAAQAAPTFTANATDTRAQVGGEPMAAIAAHGEHAPTDAVAKPTTQTSSVTTSVANAQSPRSDSTVRLEAGPASSGAGTGAARTLVAEAMSSTQVARVEVASHLMSARPAAKAMPPDTSDAAPVDAAETAPAKTKDAAVPRPVEAASAEPGAEEQSADHQVAATSILAAEATEAATSTPIRQVADAVTALAADTSRPDPTASQAAATKPSPTRSLILHLAPATLGKITVRLHLTDSGLSVRLAVENPTTLGLISHARDALQAAIGTANTLDQLVIHGADMTPPPSTGSHDSTKSDGGSLADQRSGGQRGNQESPRRSDRPATGEARPSGAGRADGLFL